MAADIRAENHGSIWLVRGFTPAGESWLQDNVDFQQWFGGAGVVEWRYVGPIVEGAREAGLELEVTQ